MHGKTTKLSDQIGMGSDVEQDRSRADNATCIGVFGHQNERVIREDGALQPELVIEFAMRIVVTVHREKDLADLTYILFSNFPDSDHRASCIDECAVTACSVADLQFWQQNGNTRLRRTAPLHRSQTC